MQNIILLICICIVSIHAKIFVCTFYVKGDCPYLSDSIIDAKYYKVVERLEKKIDNPFNDYFWPKTPVDLWNTDIRYYIITINDTGKYDLFVLNDYAYNDMWVDRYFKFERFSIYSDARFNHLIQRENIKEILEMLK